MCIRDSGGVDRYLDREINIADIAASAIIANHVHHHPFSVLLWHHGRGLGLHRRRDFDFVAVPGFNSNFAGDVLKYEADFLAGWKTLGNLTLSVHTGGTDCQRGQNYQSREKVSGRETGSREQKSIKHL